MWEKIGDFGLDSIGVAFSCIALRQIRYENRDFNAKISKISLSTVDQELDSFRMFITASTPKEFENLVNLFKGAKLIVGTFGVKELFFDANNSENLMPFFNIIQTFEPSVSELETELVRKYNKDYRNYPLKDAPFALETNKCIRYAQQGTKRSPKNLRKDERAPSKAKIG